MKTNRLHCIVFHNTVHKLLFGNTLHKLASFFQKQWEYFSHTSQESDSSGKEHSPIRIFMNQYFSMEPPMGDIHGNRGNFLSANCSRDVEPPLIKFTCIILNS